MSPTEGSSGGGRSTCLSLHRSESRSFLGLGERSDQREDLSRRLPWSRSLLRSRSLERERERERRLLLLSLWRSLSLLLLRLLLSVLLKEDGFSGCCGREGSEERTWAHLLLLALESFPLTLTLGTNISSSFMASAATFTSSSSKGF